MIDDALNGPDADRQGIGGKTNGESLESEDFLRRLRLREHESFRRLVEAYHRNLVAFVTAVAGERRAEEIVQEAWISIYKGLPDFEGRASLKTWLYTIVRNTAARVLRKEERSDLFGGRAQKDPDAELDAWYRTRFDDSGHWQEGPPPWEIASPEALLREAELQRCIDHTLTLLTPAQRAVFTLKDLERIETPEICNITGLSHTNVRVLLHRARMKLLQVIAHYQETGECLTAKKP